MKLHHVGIVITDLKSGIRHHEALFNLHPITKIVEDPVQKVAVVLLSSPRAEGPYIELIAPLTDDSAVSNVLRKGTHLYHLCFLVEDIEDALERARRQGSIIISRPTQAKLFNGRKIAFIYTPDHYIVEFLEKGCPGESVSAGDATH
jgi:methylmalonyl-CoA/ethylmalonyl-CoA epimerase